MPETNEEENEGVEQEYKHITRMRATNADVEEIQLGLVEESKVLAVPELVQDRAAVVRRRYEPVEVAEYSSPMPESVIREMLEKGEFPWGDTDVFDRFDWEAFRRRKHLHREVKLRNEYHTTISNISMELMDISPMSLDEQERVEQLEDQVEELILEFPPVAYRRVEEDGAPADKGGAGDE